MPATAEARPLPPILPRPSRYGVTPMPPTVDGDNYGVRPSDAEPEAKAKAPLRMPPVADQTGDRVPTPGDIVHFWIANHGRLECRPAWLFEYSAIRKKWSINIMMLGGLRMQHDVPFSTEPAECCWTWRAGESKAPSSASTGDVDSVLELVSQAMADVATLKAEVATLHDEDTGLRAKLAAANAEIELLKAPKASRKPTPEVKQSESAPVVA